MPFGVYTSYKDLPKGFPTLGRPEFLPSRVLEISPDGTPAAVSATEAFRQGKTGPKAVEKDFIDSALLENPLTGVKLYPPAGSKSDPAIVPVHGPTGGDMRPADHRTGIYFPSDGEIGFSSNETEVGHFFRDGLKIIHGDASDGNTGYVPALIGIIYTDFGATGTGAEEPLGTVTVPGNALQDSGRHLEIEAVLECAANANAKAIFLRWGNFALGNQIITNDITANPNGKHVIIRATVIQEAPITQRCSGTMVVGAVEQTCQSVAGNQDETLPIMVTVSTTVGLGAVNDVVLKSLRVIMI